MIMESCVVKGKLQVVPTKVPTVAGMLLLAIRYKLLMDLEARAGIEPAHKGFADLSLTTWVPRLGRAAFSFTLFQSALAHRLMPEGGWSGRRDLNSRPSPWQGDALPLSYSRLVASSSIPGGPNEVKPGSVPGLTPSIWVISLPQ